MTSTSCSSHFAHGRERCRLINDLWIKRMGGGWSVDWLRVLRVVGTDEKGKSALLVENNLL